MVHPPIARPAGLTEHMSLALPVRVGDVAKTSMSRTEIRGMCMDSLAATGSFMAQMEASAAAAEAPLFFSAKPANTRGRMLGPGQLTGANRLLQAKIQTGLWREAASDDEGDAGEEDSDVFVRFDGRERQQPALLGGTRPGFQYDPPQEGAALLGWNCKATFPTGPKNELRWHDCFVVDWRQNIQGGQAAFDYLLFFPGDGVDPSEWVRGKELPHDSICFRKPNLPNPKVGERAIAAAKADIARSSAAERDDSGASGSGPSSSGSARAMRDRADWRV